MIKKLRIKLIAVAMLSIFIVLGTIVLAINIFNYNRIVKDSDAILSVLMENDGNFPDFFFGKHGRMNDEENFPHGGAQGGPDMANPPVISDILGSPETPYESRFFTVTFDESGNITDVDTGRIARTDSDGASLIASSVYKNDSVKGFYENYRFLKQKNNSDTRIIFLDCSRNLSNFKNTLLTSIIISLLGLASVFVLVVIFSRRIVKPVSESYEKQKEFITNAGHEIKTPLAIISADAEVIEMENGESEWTDDILTQTKRLTSLTNDLIYLAKMEETAAETTSILFPFSDMVNEAASPFAAFARASGKGFKLDIEPGISINGDEKNLYKLVSILLDNASKYSPDNGNIKVSLRSVKNRAILSVTNTVIEPLAEKDLAHFFDRFYRLDKSRSTDKGGYGIGLSVARAITDKHKGKIKAINSGDDTLTIEASLPL